MGKETKFRGWVGEGIFRTEFVKLKSRVFVFLEYQSSLSSQSFGKIQYALKLLGVVVQAENESVRCVEH